MSVIQNANKLIKEGKIKYVSGNKYGQTYDVDGYIVKIIKKEGRVEDSCSCRNHARFCNINPRCSHKLALSTYLVMRNICIDCGASINPHRDYKAKRCPSCSKKGKLNPEFGKTREKHHRWKGGRHISASGYVRLHSPEHPARDSRNYVSEHMVVVEKKIGRYLKREEVVHHIDGNKANNDIGNLRLMTNSEHMKYHTAQRRLNYVTTGV